MLNVWSVTDSGLRKRRTVIAGNFQDLDPTAQRWTAQAEPGTIFMAAKLAALRGWKISKVDVKGAFLNAPIPPGELVLVQPPGQWVKWGIVKEHVVWKLNRAVYGLRQSPKWWGDERDRQLAKLRWSVGTSTYYLEQNVADSQVWAMRRQGDNLATQGLLCVYVDDFLILSEENPARKGLVEALLKIWEFGPERTLSPDTSITFLGIVWYMDGGGDIRLTQDRFTEELLVKYSKETCKPLRNVTMDKLPDEPDPPTAEQLRDLQAFAGAFNWLATRTRPDVAYYTSVLASASSRKRKWG